MPIDAGCREEAETTSFFLACGIRYAHGIGTETQEVIQRLGSLASSSVLAKVQSTVPLQEKEGLL